jgi:hypothetical protein
MSHAFISDLIVIPDGQKRQKELLLVANVGVKVNHFNSLIQSDLYGAMQGDPMRGIVAGQQGCLLAPAWQSARLAACDLFYNLPILRINRR